MEESRLQLSALSRSDKELDETERRLFGHLTQVDEERQQLYENLSSNWFKTRRRIIKLFMNNLLIKLSSKESEESADADHLGDHLCNVFALDAGQSPIHRRISGAGEVENKLIECEAGLIMRGADAPEESLCRRRKKRLIFVGCMLIFIYMIVKCITIASLQYKFGCLLETNQELSSNFSSRNYHHTTCKEPFEPNDYNIDCYRISALFTKLDLLGAPNPSLTGLCVSFLAILTEINIFYFICPILYISATRFRVDNLAFIFNPAAERARLLKEANLISKNLAQSVRRYRAGSLERSKGFVRILLDASCRSKLPIEPAIVSANWHRQSTKYWSTFLVFDLACAFSVGIFYFFAGAICELLVRSRVRLQQLGFHSDALFLIEKKGSFYVSLKQLTDTDLAAYQAFDGSTMSYLNLALLVETKYSFSWQKTLFSFEAVLFVALAAGSGVFYNCLYMNSCIDKIAWTNQIEGQIEHCSLQLARRRHLSIDSCTTQEADEADTRILKLVTISYLNFELFRRQQKFQQKLSICCLLQAFSLGLSILVICYQIGTNISSAYTTPILLLATYIMCLLNIALVSAAYLTSKIDRINLAIMKLLARAAFNQTNSSISSPMAFWRRQMLDEREARLMLAPSLFGLCITYDKIITFNAYVVGLWLILSK